MRLRAVAHVVGALIAGVGVTMLLAAFVALLYQEEDLFALIISSVVTIASGLGVFLVTGKAHEKVEITHRDGFAVVTFGWFASCIFGALPYFFFAHLPAVFFPNALAHSAQVEQLDTAPEGSAVQLKKAFDVVHSLDETLVSPPNCAKGMGLGVEFCSFSNAMFESTSGFTTTGATILEAGLWNSPKGRAKGLPHGILFWRALTHLLGGMGIIVLGVAVLPLLGVGGMQLFKAEVPGPVKDKMAPKVAETARLLWTVYAALTTVQFLLLLLTGQGPYLALCHSFATMATGGFSPLAQSVEGLNSPLAEWIITFFMFLAGANFALHFASMRKRRLIHYRDHEFRFYTAVTVVFSLFAAVGLFWQENMGLHDGLRAGAFQTASILTTTGFSTHDFAKWGIGIQVVLFVLFFIGGCSGSTGGGIKCVRFFLMLKLAVRELRRLTHPHAVIQTKLSRQVVSDDVIRSIAGFVMLYFVIFFTSVLIFGIAGYDFKTSLTAVGANLGNIGPGLGPVGPAGNYNFFAAPLKWLCIFDMLAGRLEIYSVLIVLTPGFWRK